MAEMGKAAVLSGYQPQGTYQPIGGLKTYVTGPVSGSDVAVLMVYDGFGYQAPTLQGADIIASKMGAAVFMPDFLDGGMPLNYQDMHGTPEGKAYLEHFTGEQGPAYKPKLIRQITAFANTLRHTYPTIHKLCGLGLGYGGKVLAMACNAGAALDASAQAFPSKPSSDEAAGLRHAHLILASGDEDPDGVRAYEAPGLPAGSKVCRYPDMKHGWMGGLGKLDDARVAEQFRNGYHEFAAWALAVLR